MKKLFIIILLSNFLPAFGQTGSISGKLQNGIDDSNSWFISVDLLNETDDSKIAATLSDTNGVFNFKNVKPGIYKLIFSFVGHEKYELPHICVTTDSTTSLEVSYPCPYGNTKSKKVCPYGHKDQIIPIGYGLPTTKGLRRAEKGKIYLGGCTISECDPQWYCKKHKIRF
jgi:hypothetical protein